VHLVRLTTLEDVRLYYTQITGVGIAELKKALPNCKVNGK